ncbi:glucose dehydrogenase [Halomonas sp. WWR20]
MVSTKPTRGTGGWILLVFAVVLVVLGLILAAGGAWLVTLEGSWYYLIAGIGLIFSGAMLARDSLTGAWLYLAVFLGTLVWAFWEVGLDMWGLLPRVFGYIVLGIILLLLLPTLKYRQVHE